jgi:plastocyanin
MNRSGISNRLSMRTARRKTSSSRLRFTVATRIPSRTRRESGAFITIEATASTAAGINQDGLRCVAPTTSKMMSARLLAAVALLTLGVVACGGTGTSPTASTSSPAIGIAGGKLGAAAVIIASTDQNTFDPAMQDATVDEIIEWKNTGSVTHNLVFGRDASIGDPVLAGGGVWQVKFTVAGTYQYSCTIHDGMVGTIVVRPG